VQIDFVVPEPASSVMLALVTLVFTTTRTRRESRSA